MKKIMMIGKIGCGKTTLAQRLLGEEIRYKKTQAIQIVGDDIVDTPGEYLEQKQFYNALIVTAVEADVILLLFSAIEEQSSFSPRMCSMFYGKPMIGVLTKTDLCKDPKQLAAGREQLFLAGAETVLEVGLGDTKCIQTLRNAIERTQEGYR